MANRTETGTLFIAHDALLPASLRFESDACSSDSHTNGWRRVTNCDAYGLDRQLREAGWTFFDVAGEISASVLGWGHEKALGRVIDKALARITAGGSNCLEIARVTAKRFLGLHYICVSAHPRHIQEGMHLAHRKRLGELDRLGPAAALPRA